MKITGESVYYVKFGEYGCLAYMSVTMYEGLTVAECIKLRCADATGYISDGVYVDIA